MKALRHPKARCQIGSPNRVANLPSRITTALYLLGAIAWARPPSKFTTAWYLLVEGSADWFGASVTAVSRCRRPVGFKRAQFEATSGYRQAIPNHPNALGARTSITSRLKGHAMVVWCGVVLVVCGYGGVYIRLQVSNLLAPRGIQTQPNLGRLSLIWKWDHFGPTSGVSNHLELPQAHPRLGGAYKLYISALYAR